MTSTSPTQNQHSTFAMALYRCSLILGGLAWLFVASTLCGCSATNGWVMNKSGESYYARGNYNAARYEFERALMDNPNNSNYAYNIAKTMEKQGDIEAAEEMYQSALSIDPSHELAYHGLADMLIDQGREEDAGALLQAWADTQPYLPESQLELADYYQDQGDVEAASDYSRRAARLRARRQQQPMNSNLAAQYGQQPQTMSPYQAQVNSQYQSMLAGRQLSPAQQMTRNMQRTDPTMMGGFAAAPTMPRAPYIASNRSMVMPQTTMPQNMMPQTMMSQPMTQQRAIAQGIPIQTMAAMPTPTTFPSQQFSQPAMGPSAMAPSITYSQPTYSQPMTSQGFSSVPQGVPMSSPLQSQTMMTQGTPTEWTTSSPALLPGQMAPTTSATPTMATPTMATQMTSPLTPLPDHTYNPPTFAPAAQQPTMIGNAIQATQAF